MSRRKDAINECEKNRIRNEIDAQIAEFLKAGGKIDVLADKQSNPKSAIGAVWRNGDDLPGLGQ